MQQDPLPLLREFVRIPSINPRLCPDPEVAGEQRLAREIAELLQRNGFEVELPEVFPDRPNVVARLAGSTASAVCFCAHLDTMPVDDMTVPPFAADLRDGNVWGRGACDTKASLAAMCAAALTISTRPVRERPTLLLLFTCDEEAGFRGAEYFADALGAASSPDSIMGAVIGEPTGLRPVTAHKGVLRCRVRTAGRSAHAATPELGDNAIYRMAKVISRIEGFAERLQQSGQRHPLLGAPTLVIGTIHGGTAVNTVPAECTAELDRRLLPGERPEGALEEIRSAVADVPDATVEPPFLSVPGMELPSGHPLRRVLNEVLGEFPDAGVPYATDASLLAQAGIGCLILGPGSPEAAHTADEHVPVREVRRAAGMYERILIAAARLQGE